MASDGNCVVKTSKPERCNKTLGYANRSSELSRQTILWLEAWKSSSADCGRTENAAIASFTDAYG